VATLLDALASGRIFAAVLVALLIEAALFVALGARKGRGLAIAAWLPALTAGCGLALAGLCISLEVDPRFVGASLLLALGGHVTDLRLRARRHPI
jgi:hypothetical protein